MNCLREKISAKDLQVVHQAITEFIENATGMNELDEAEDYADNLGTEEHRHAVRKKRAVLCA